MLLLSSFYTSTSSSSQPSLAISGEAIPAFCVRVCVRARARAIWLPPSLCVVDKNSRERRVSEQEFACVVCRWLHMELVGPTYLAGGRETAIWWPSATTLTPTHTSAGRTLRSLSLSIYICIYKLQQQKYRLEAGKGQISKGWNVVTGARGLFVHYLLLFLPCGLALNRGHTNTPAQRRCNMKTLLLLPSLFSPDLTLGLTLLVLLLYTFSIGLTLLDYRIVRGTFLHYQLSPKPNIFFSNDTGRLKKKSRWPSLPPPSL